MPLNTRMLLWTLTGVFLLFSATSWAEEPALSAKQFVEQQFALVKQTQSLSPLVQHVDWDKAFYGSPMDMRLAFAFESAAEMKSQFQLLVTSPPAFSEKLIEYGMRKMRQAGVPEDQIARAKEQTIYTQEGLEKNFSMLVRDLASADYKVGREEAQNNGAHVWISFIFRKKPSDFPLKLNKKDGQWRFTQVPLFDSNN